MYHPDNGQRSYKPQTKHAERMILPSSSQKHSWTYLWVHGSWETDRFCHLSFSFFLLSHTKLWAVVKQETKQNEMAKQSETGSHTQNIDSDCTWSYHTIALKCRLNWADIVILDTNQISIFCNVCTLSLFMSWLFFCLLGEHVHRNTFCVITPFFRDKIISVLVAKLISRV